MAKTLPVVESVADLTRPENGALFWLEPRQSLHDLQSPKVALGEHADYAVDYYRKEFAPRQDRPFVAYFKEFAILYGRQFSILDQQRHAFEDCFTRDRRWREGVPKNQKAARAEKIRRPVSCSRAWNFTITTRTFFVTCCRGMKLFEEAGLAGQVPVLLPPPGPRHLPRRRGTNWGLPAIARCDGTMVAGRPDGLYFASTYQDASVRHVDSASQPCGSARNSVPA